jgi:hypothetical protein
VAGAGRFATLYRFGHLTVHVARGIVKID